MTQFGTFERGSAVKLKIKAAIVMSNCGKLACDPLRILTKSWQKILFRGIFRGMVGSGNIIYCNITIS